MSAAVIESDEAAIVTTRKKPRGIAAYNHYVEEGGVFSDGVRSF